MRFWKTTRHLIKKIQPNLKPEIYKIVTWKSQIKSPQKWQLQSFRYPTQGLNLYFFALQPPVTFRGENVVRSQTDQSQRFAPEEVWTLPNKDDNIRYKQILAGK